MQDPLTDEFTDASKQKPIAGARLMLRCAAAFRALRVSRQGQFTHAESAGFNAIRRGGSFA